MSLPSSPSHAPGQAGTRHWGAPALGVGHPGRAIRRGGGGGGCRCSVCGTLLCTACCILWCTVCRALCYQCTHTVVVPCVVRCSLCPCAHPCLTCLPCPPCGEGGGGGSGSQWERGRLPPLCQQGGRNAANKSPGAAVPCGEGRGRSSVAAGRGRLALRAHRDTGTTSRSGQGG